MLKFFRTVTHTFNCIIPCVIIFFVCAHLFITTTWEYVSFPQLMFFLSGNYKNCPEILIYKTVFFCFILPTIISVLFLIVYIKKAGILKYPYRYFFFSLFISVLCLFYIKHSFPSIFNFQSSDFYEKNFEYVNNIKINKKNKRNVILVFLESFEDRYKIYKKYKKTTFEINDYNAVKFDNFLEGYSQEWTQAALFSAFTGTHIYYLSDYFRYRLPDIKFGKKGYMHQFSNKSGESFSYQTPNIMYLSDITAYNGYTNIFVQGAENSFSGTQNFLTNHNFIPSNIYERASFPPQKELKNNKHWWSVPDYMVFELFKNKITELDKKQPFFAVMFTSDMHHGMNPYYPTLDEKNISTIENVNNFIEWFERQPFYENTTLILLADHRLKKRLSNKQKLYNAFFNLPENLKFNLDKKRTFNQIDVFPSILDILGVETKNGKAGVGTSIFSKNKTIAEKYDYEEQKKIFSSVDKFYVKLWDEDCFFEQNIFPTSLIAHAGGNIDGKKYTNSLEAMNLSAKKGYKYIELDLLVTDDEKPRILAAHDRKNLFRNTNTVYQNKLYADTFYNKKLFGKYSIPFDNDIVKFFNKNNDIRLVTDKIDNFNLLSEKFASIKNRMIVEVFSEQKYKEAKVNGFKHIAFAVFNEYFLDKVLKNKYDMITVPINFAKQNMEKLLELKKQGVKILVYTAKNIDELQSLKNVSDFIYYDGTESLI